MLRSSSIGFLIGLILLMITQILSYHSQEYKIYDKLDELKQAWKRMEYRDYNDLWEKELKENKAFEAFIKKWQSKRPEISGYHMKDINFYSLKIQTFLIDLRRPPTYSYIAFGLFFLSILLGFVFGILQKRKKTEETKKKSKIIFLILILLNIAAGYFLVQEMKKDAEKKVKRLKQRPPFMIKNLSVKAISSKEIELKWEDTEYETGYKVMRVCYSDGESKFKEIADLKANTTTYKDSGLKSATKYKYNVIPYNAYGKSKMFVLETIVSVKTKP